MKIVFTGGGTGGHVIPNIALIEQIKNEKDIEILYIGSKNGIEKELIERKGIEYIQIETGKLRRYISKKNVEDFFKVFKGIGQARKIIAEEKPDIVFSKGGFVSVPVVLGAYFNKVPVIIHESDMTPGLANKISLPFAKRICVSFPETLSHVNKKKAVLTGSPVRGELFTGNIEKARKIFKITNDKPIITIMGGSLGSDVVNKAVRSIINKLTKTYNVIHLCGKGKVDNGLKNVDSYYQYEYIDGEMKEIFAITDLFISRAGANSIFEILLTGKPNILIPLSKKASRGDQILNAESFKRQGFSYVVSEEELNGETLDSAIKNVVSNASKYKKAMRKTNYKNGTSMIISLIKENALTRT